MPRGTSRYDEARVQGRLWTPDVWRGGILLAWYDAMEGPFTYATGVSQWNDKSGRGFHVAQATGGNQPLLTQGYLNGRPSVVFDGTSDHLTIASFTWSIAWSAFAVWLPTSVTGVRSIIDTDPQTGTRHGQNLRQNGASLETIGFNTLGSVFGDAGGTVANSTPTLGVGVRSATALEAWLNGSSGGSTAATGTGVSGTGRFSLGITGNLSSQFFAGGLGEAIMCNRDLYAYERQVLEGYGAWRWWGSSNTLPASHPFKNRPPLIGG